MSSIPNSESAPAAAHSPNSDEEIEDAVDSDNWPPNQEYFLVKGNRRLHEKMCVIKEFLTILILLLIINGFVQNHFSTDEGDHPDSFLQNLYKFLASTSGDPISTEPADDSNREAAKILSKAKLFKELDKIYYRPDEEGSYGGIQN